MVDHCSRYYSRITVTSIQCLTSTIQKKILFLLKEITKTKTLTEYLGHSTKKKWAQKIKAHRSLKANAFMPS